MRHTSRSERKPVGRSRLQETYRLAVPPSTAEGQQIEEDLSDLLERQCCE